MQILETTNRRKQAKHPIKEMTPVISVLMPVYNAAKYIREAIESILQQTLTEFEFVIIDDGSTDESAQIIRSYTDPRIRLIQNEKNIGITATLNEGIQLASCELIARMDADDISYPERLEKQYGYFQRHPECVLLSNAVRYISATKEQARNVYFNNDFIYYELIYTCKINHPVVMFRKSVVLREGGYQTKYAEDFNLWWRLSRKYSFFHDNEILLDYRYSETSLWKVTTKNEYDYAEYQQIVENIRYYSGGQLTFTYDEVDFLRKDLKILLEKHGIKFIEGCFNKLRLLNKFVLAKEKYGSKWENTRRAAFEKQRERIRNLGKHLGRKRVLILLIRLRYWGLLSEELEKAYGNALKKIKLTKA